MRITVVTFLVNNSIKMHGANNVVKFPKMFVNFNKSYFDTPHSVGFLWTSDRPDAETSTWQHTTFLRDTHPCPRAGFELTIPASERPQTYALDRAAAGICSDLISRRNFIRRHIFRDVEALGVISAVVAGTVTGCVYRLVSRESPSWTQPTLTYVFPSLQSIPQTS
jgi:hypothetical protein